MRHTVQNRLVCDIYDDTAENILILVAMLKSGLPFSRMLVTKWWSLGVTGGGIGMRAKLASRAWHWAAYRGHLSK